MNVVIFIIIALILLAVSMVVILRTLLKVDTHKNHTLEKQREADNVNHLKKQIADLQIKKDNQEVNQQEFEQYKLEIERRLLNSVKSINLEKQKSPVAFVIVICSVLPVLVILLYLVLGSPSTLSPENIQAVEHARKEPRTVKQAFAEIQQRLQRDPQDSEARFALGRLYYANSQFNEARDTFKILFDQQPDRPDVLIAYAEAQARTQNNMFKGMPLELIQRAIQLDPQNKKANWLLGITAFQDNNKKEAMRIWQQQLNRNDNSPQEQKMLQQMIAQAGGEPQAPVKQNTDEPPHLAITTSISKGLAGKYKPEDTVFIYAKAASGPQMPLAIYRTKAGKLPLSLTLTDSDAMSPQMKLSSFNQVIIYARISTSGEAIPQSGDLEGKTGILKNNAQDIKVEINTIIP